MGTQLPFPKGVQPPQFSAHIRCSQMAAWIKMPLGMEVGLGPGDFVLYGDPLPSAKRGRSPPPILGSCLLWPKGWMHQDATWYGARPQPRGLCIRWGPRPLSKFTAHVYCGQTAGWIKMALGIEVSLTPGDFVLHGDPAPIPKRGRSPLPNFRPIYTVAKRLDASRSHSVWR